MYISWRREGAIAVSTSLDGYHWSELKIVLNKGVSQSWESIVNRASYDFIKYKNNPVLIPEKDYEKESVMNPHVIYDNEEKIFNTFTAKFINKFFNDKFFYK